MADITMCDNKECKLKDECYRYNAQPNMYFQSYLLNPKEVCEENGYEKFEKMVGQDE